MKRGDRASFFAAIALGAASFAALDFAVASSSAMAQPVSALPACAAPGPDEYLLLVVLQTEAAQSKLVETLPPSVSAPTCNYLGSRVARMGGFQTPEDADAWASYLRDAASLPAFVAKPTKGAATTVAAAPSAVNAIQDPAIQDPANLAAAQSAGQPTTPIVSPAASAEEAQPQRIAPPLDVLPPPMVPAQPRVGNQVDVPQPGEARAIAPPRPTAAAPPAVPVAQAAPVSAAKTPPAGAFSVKTYSPKGLTDGYAVLVDYGNQTSLVPLLRQLTKKPVGLASYGQRPFLMVNYTTDSGAALTTLDTLSRSGFRTMLVEGRRVTLLTPDVQVK